MKLFINGMQYKDSNSLDCSEIVAEKKTLIHPKYRSDIDGLRAIAVLSVVAYHAFPFWLKGGFIGVDIFFVISGFLISTIIFESLKAETFSFSKFYSRRVKRIFPALFLVLLASLVYGWFALLPSEYVQLGKHVAGGAGFVSNILLWMESGYFDTASDLKPLLHLWSLGIEEQFYIVWPLLLWLAWKPRLNWLTMVVVLGVISFQLNLHGLKKDAISTFYAPYTRFWELLIGSFIACCSLRFNGNASAAKTTAEMTVQRIIFSKPYDPSKNLISEILSVTGAVLLAVGLVKITSDRPFPGTWALLPTMGAALIIAGGPKAFINRTVLSNKLLVWFGLISFPLYLWHWPLLAFLRIHEGELPARNLRVAVVLVSILLAWLTYRFVEKPLRSGPDRAARTLTIAGLMAVLGIAGLCVVWSDGAPFRFPKVVQELNSLAYDDKAYRAYTCFLYPDQAYDVFSKCEDSHRPNNKELLLWGDSHAAHLYPGFKKNFEGQYNIVQRTASGCPPILGFEITGTSWLVRPKCLGINNSIFDYIKNSRPDRIVLAANWGLYDWPQIKRTIVALQGIGINNIDVIGPVPQWKESLPKQLYRYFEKDPSHRLPIRMSNGLELQFTEIDEKMSELIKGMGARYISPKNILCNDDGCLTRFGDTADTLSAWDYGHLTKVGSEYLVSKFPK